MELRAENVQVRVNASLVYRARYRDWPLTAHFLGVHARHKGEALHSVGPTLWVCVELAQNLFFGVLLLEKTIFTTTSNQK